MVLHWNQSDYATVLGAVEQPLSKPQDPHSNDDPDTAIALAAIEKECEEAVQRQFDFLLAGRTGVGKSSTINSLLGKVVAPVDDYEPCTMEVKSYPTQIGKVRFNVVDTPGLCDGVPAAEGEKAYLKKMAQSVPKVDCFWFVSRLDDTRVRKDEIDAIALITDAFGSEIWQHAIIVFTFANGVHKERYAEALAKRGSLIRKELARHTGGAIANAVPAVAVENTSNTTPDGRTWKGTLYTTVFQRVSKGGLLPFYLATAFMTREHNEEETRAESDRFLPVDLIPTIDLTREQRDKIDGLVKQNIVDLCASKGAKVGEKIDKFFTGSGGGSFGRSIGGAVGRTVGGLLKLFGF
jgi:GTP-binding protein EngB required for normal cell division